MATCKAQLHSYVDNNDLQKLIIVYQHRGKKLKLPTNFKVKASEFDSKSGLTNDNDINSVLLAEVKKVDTIVRNLQEQGFDPDVKSLKRELDKLQDAENNKRNNALTEAELLDKKFIEWFDLHLEGVSNYNTHKVQRIVRNHIYNYDKNVKLREIDYQWLEGFSNYLSSVVSSHNTIYTYVKRIGIVLNTVRKHCRKYPKIKLHLQNIKEDLKDVKGVEKYSDPVGLDYNMFLHLFKFDDFTEKTEHLRAVRDMFVLGTSISGNRIEDLYNISDSDIRKEILMVNGEAREVWLVDYYEKKTKTFHNDVPVLDFGAEILEMYNGKLPVKKARAVFNRQLKELGQLLGWDHEVIEKSFNSDGSLKDIKRYPFFSVMSSKMMRKTRTTIDEVAGIEESISRMATGHNSKARDRYNVKTVATMVLGNLKHSEIYQQIKKAE